MGITDKEDLKYYHNVINEFKSNGIEPYATLFHPDNPNTLNEILKFHFFQSHPHINKIMTS